MTLAKILTPQNTEEIKPGLFIQDRGKGNYRMITPLAWDGKIQWKRQFKTVFRLRTLLTMAVIIFLTWSYLNDTGTLQQFYNNMTTDPVACYALCSNVERLQNEKERDTLTIQGIYEVPPGEVLGG